MIEKVNPEHPDKVADRIAGAIVDLAYTKNNRPKIAVEVLIGHKTGLIIAETSEHFEEKEIKRILSRIAPEAQGVNYLEVPQDEHLAENQEDELIRCGDNGIFRGVPLNDEEEAIGEIARRIFHIFKTDGKYILDQGTDRFVACQSHCTEEQAEYIRDEAGGYETIVNPLGYWTGGIDVDSGATNRKLGSDMGRAVTGGGLHGKDLSKADVSVNIYCHLLAQKEQQPIEARCAIGDRSVYVKHGENGDEELVTYWSIVETAKEYIDELGGFEKLAEWGLF